MSSAATGLYGARPAYDLTEKLGPRKRQKQGLNRARAPGGDAR